MAKGFNRPAGSGGQAGMMQHLQRLQQQMAEAQDRLALEIVTATAGGGAVTVAMTGDQKCQSVKIDPALLAETDAELIQDLVLTAVNLALEKSRQLQEQVMGPLAGGLPG
jgi:DNA-binding YbaB/EbfC family protein